MITIGFYLDLATCSLQQSGLTADAFVWGYFLITVEA